MAVGLRAGLCLLVGVAASLPACTNSSSDEPAGAAAHHWPCSAHPPVRWREAVGGAVPYVFFVHLRKCGGSSVEFLLAREARTTAYYQHIVSHHREFPDEDPEQPFRWFQRNHFGKLGHYNYSQYHHLHRSINQQRKPFYMTMLRHPVDRIASAYWFWHRFWRYKAAMVNPDGSSRMTLTEFVEGGSNDDYARNNHQFVALRDRGDATVEQVVRTLAANFSFVGVLERFDESMALLSAQLGIDTSYDVARNTAQVDKVDALHHRVTAAERAVILRHNRLDYELWQAANRLLDEQAACHRARGGLPLQARNRSAV